MPWRPIQTATAGWLSLLGLKNLGRNPDEVLEQVRPTSEMTGFWLRGIAEWGQEGITTTFAQEAFGPSFLVASESEWIYVHSAFAQGFSPGGGSNVLRINVFKSIPGNSKTILRLGPASSVSFSGGGLSLLELRDFWMPPGFLLQAEIAGAVGDSIDVGALYSRVRV